MPFCPANGLAIYYELNGEGDRLLAISGSGGDLRRHPSPGQGPLGTHFTVLAYDQRGLGQSDTPDGPYTMADYGDDAAALMDAIGWDDCSVLGTSFGGMVALELALRHPGRVRRLVLACTSAGGTGGASYPLHELADMDPARRIAFQLELMDTRWDADWQATHPDEVNLFAQGFEYAVLAPGTRLQLEARRHHDTSDRLADVRCPTLVCAGRYDGIAPPANSEFLAAHIPGACLAMFDGGHVFLLQDPSAIPAIIDFLQE
jgi:3-oxoadipate enol-lactonase